ncbi:ROK family protein [Neobacillus sp. NRS-1170]|uniref:ROK family protein n=1 Tax=Neobacillus sp. NRS-1170 TaxID=3233898 RepID=UPI003D26AA25
MKADVVFALDVGGTYIKACVLEQDRILEETICQFEAHSHESQENILTHFVGILTALAAKYKQNANLEQKGLGIGFTFPGPFDYENGISYIKGLNKFESLYGVNLREQLFHRLLATELGLEVKNFNLIFENDGRLFGLGASTIFPNERIICLTIGTGLGSVFIDRGKIIKTAESIPAEGYLYNQPFMDSIIDNHFSRRGILNAAAAKGMTQVGVDVKELAEMSRNGNSTTASLFAQFGDDLGEMLLPYIEKFQPHRIIIGGQIAKAFDLFQNCLEEKLKKTKVNSLDNALHYTFLGISRMFA